MKHKNYDFIPPNSSDSDFRDVSSRHNLSNYDYDLFKEEDDKVEAVFHVKRMSNKMDKWKIFKNNKIIDELSGSSFTAKEKDFLYTVQGLKFIMSYYKSGFKSIRNMKNEMKIAMESKPEEEKIKPIYDDLLPVPKKRKIKSRKRN